MISSKQKTITEFQGEFRFLSNFAKTPFLWRSIQVMTAEHAYQSEKTTDDVWRKRILEAVSPTLAKRFGRLAPLQPDWDRKKTLVMSDIVSEKFMQNPNLIEALCRTYPAELEEGNDWNDRYWGKVNGVGENYLGKILMTLRDQCLCMNCKMIRVQRHCFPPEMRCHCED